jgi:hypothetical protein
MRDIKESDWKIFKGVREVALERFCERSSTRSSASVRTLPRPSTSDTWRSIGSCVIATRRRSTAVRQLFAFRYHNLLTEQELLQFSPELVKTIKNIHEIYTRPIEVVDEDGEEDRD